MTSIEEFGRFEEFGEFEEFEKTGPALVGSGVDIVGIDRIGRLLEEFGRSFETRVFTPAEREYCSTRPDPPQHFAARWAAKEAFRKAIAAGGPTVPFDAVGVVRGEGGPTLALDPRATAALARTLRQAGRSPGRAVNSVSLAHDRPNGFAVAHVLLGAGAPDPPDGGSTGPRDER